MMVLIMGCGRLGAELAVSLEKDGHTITILDVDKYAFDHLPQDFKGIRMIGNDVLPSQVGGTKSRYGNC